MNSSPMIRANSRSVMMSGSPRDYAQALVEFLDLQWPFEFDQVASEIGLQLREVPSMGFDGALVRRPGEARGIIAIRDTIPEPVSRRFTIAHEIGHYVLPGHDTNYSVCTEEGVDLLREHVREDEHEANQFAAWLLLPTTELNNLTNDLATPLN